MGLLLIISHQVRRPMATVRDLDPGGQLVFERPGRVADSELTQAIGRPGTGGSDDDQPTQIQVRGGRA
jgi:hypothetical protein